MTAAQESIRQDASSTLRNILDARTTHDHQSDFLAQLQERAAKARADFEALMMRRDPPATVSDAERAKRRKEDAEQRRSVAEQVCRQTRLTVDSLTAQFHSTDLPRILQVL